MHSLLRRRSRVVRGSAAAFGLAALVASLAIITHPVGKASAAVNVGPNVTITHGCDVGDGLGDFVVAHISAGNGAIDPSNPDVIQIGLAVSKNNQDAYGDGAGPVLVKFSGTSEVVRLTGPIRGAHVFVRQYHSDNAYLTIPVPAACTRIAPPVFEQAQPQVINGGNVANCLSSDATLPVIIWNDGDVEADYTVLLVDSNGRIVGSDMQGLLVSVPAHTKQPVTVSQPYVSVTTVYQFSVRALGVDGTPTPTTGVRGVQCDANGHHGPQPTKSPVLPSQTPTPPAGGPSSGHHPSSGPSTSAAHSRPAHSTAASSQSAPVVRVSNSSASDSASSAAGNGNDGGSDTGNSGGAVVVSSDSGGPVLGDADSTRQPGKPKPSATPSGKQIVIGQAVLSSVTSGAGLGGALVLLAFAAALGGMVVANRASARRR